MQIHHLIKISLVDCLTLCYMGVPGSICCFLFWGQKYLTLVISKLKHRMAMKLSTL